MPSLCHRCLLGTASAPRCRAGACMAWRTRRIARDAACVVRREVRLLCGVLSAKLGVRTPPVATSAQRGIAGRKLPRIILPALTFWHTARCVPRRSAANLRSQLEHCTSCGSEGRTHAGRSSGRYCGSGEMRWQGARVRVCSATGAVGFSTMSEMSAAWSSRSWSVLPLPGRYCTVAWVSGDIAASVRGLGAAFAFPPPMGGSGRSSGRLVACLGCDAGGSAGAAVAVGGAAGAAGDAADAAGGAAGAAGAAFDAWRKLASHCSSVALSCSFFSRACAASERGERGEKGEAGDDAGCDRAEPLCGGDAKGGGGGVGMAAGRGLHREEEALSADS
eukprot:3410833-Prymnesium_polylepis.3